MGSLSVPPDVSEENVLRGEITPENMGYAGTVGNRLANSSSRKGRGSGTRETQGSRDQSPIYQSGNVDCETGFDRGLNYTPDLYRLKLYPDPIDLNLYWAQD